MRRRAASAVASRLGRLLEQQAGVATTTSGGLFGTTGRLPGTGARVGTAGQARAAAALPATAAAVRVAPHVLPLTKTDEFGAISILENEAAGSFVPQVYENVDGRRIEDGRYAAFTKDLTGAWIVVAVRAGIFVSHTGRKHPPSCRQAACSCELHLHHRLCQQLLSGSHHIIALLPSIGTGSPADSQLLSVQR